MVLGEEGEEEPVMVRRSFPHSPRYMLHLPPPPPFCMLALPAFRRLPFLPSAWKAWPVVLVVDLRSHV